MPRPITVDANRFVYTLYPLVRGRLQQLAPFLDTTFGDRLADQSIRHGVHRITSYRSSGDFQGQLPKGDALYLAKMMMDAGFNNQLSGTGTNGVVVDMLDTAQRVALEQIRAYEIQQDVEITGQTP